MNDTPTSPPAKKGSPPPYRVYFIKGEGENAIWLELGAGWENSDGKGFNLVLDVLPIGGLTGGKLTVRKSEQKTGG